jgi:hypothetical protein
MSARVIGVSTALDSRLVFRVLDVHSEVRLFEGDSEVFGVRSGQVPQDHPLDPLVTYTARYNNNDGGAGVLHYRVIEARGQEVVRHEVNIEDIDRPEVIEQQFSCQPSPAVPVPA